MSLEDTLEEEKKKDAEAAHQNNLLTYGDLFHQFMQHERFQRFIACNYEINVIKEEVDGKKTVRTVVLEVPDEDVQKKLMDLFKTPEGEVDIKIPTAAEISKLGK